MNEQLLHDIKVLLESMEGNSQWFKDRSTASKLLEELSRVNDNLASVNTNLEIIQANQNKMDENLTAIWRRLN